MHSTGQGIKSPERPCVRPTFEAPYLHNCARWTHAHNGPRIVSKLLLTNRMVPWLEMLII